MGLASRTLWTLRQYWADRLGVPPTSFEEAGVTVGSTESDGIHVFCRNDAIVVGAPHARSGSVEDRAEALSSLCTDDCDAIQEWLTRFDGVEHVLGPSFYGYADRETFVPVDSDARVLRSADNARFRAFRRSIPDEEWEAGGPPFAPGETVGVFADEELVAVAGFEIWDGLLAHIAVVTHPDHRDRGYGQAVVSRATAEALADGFVPQYRTSDAWPWSVALARNLGFQRFATAYLGVVSSDFSHD